MNGKNYSINPKKIIFAVIFVCFFQNLFCESLKIGGSSGWQDIEMRNGIVTGKGRFGYESLELERNNTFITSQTDLLIDFEDNCVRDVTNRYDIESNTTFISEKAIIGKGSALSRGIKGGIRVHGNKNSLFGSEGPSGSVKIEFWINPSVVDNGEVLLNWRSSINDVEGVIYQVISVSFYQNRVMCLFSNIFKGQKKDMGDVRLITDRKIIPEKWSHHSISFDEETGALEYRIDGELEAIKFMTTTGHEDGGIYPIELGVCADLEIVPIYTGYIDNFCITRTSGKENDLLIAENAGFLNSNFYRVSGGRFETKPLLVKAGSIFNSIETVQSVPKQTAINYYVRSGDNCYNWTENYPEWKMILPGEEIKGVEGMYFQLAAELFPDGSGAVTPSVTEIKLNWTSVKDPLPPFNLSAQKGNGMVTLSWNYSVDDNAGGYYIYYGTRPGEYLGRFAAEGPSPINVGTATSFSVTGLQNGAIYYFAVAAWSKNDDRIVGPLSKEVFARPSIK